MKKIFSIQKVVVMAILFVVATFITPHSMAQGRLNFGFLQPQEKSTLPKSKVPFQTAVRKAKATIPGTLKAEKDGEFVLVSGWEMLEAEKVAATGETISKPAFKTTSSYNATVPGTVLTTLVQQGVYPDPYFGLNNLAISDTLCRMDWWYRMPVRLPENCSGKTIWLLFNGINYKADNYSTGLSKVAFRVAVLKERANEFLLERRRWFDLKRTGKVKEAFAAVGKTILNERMLWPVPLDELNNNPAIKQKDQNPGY